MNYFTLPSLEKLLTELFSLDRVIYKAVRVKCRKYCSVEKHNLSSSRLGKFCFQHFVAVCDPPLPKSAFLCVTLAAWAHSVKQAGLELICLSLPLSAAIKGVCLQLLSVSIVMHFLYCIVYVTLNILKYLVI